MQLFLFQIYFKICKKTKSLFNYSALFFLFFISISYQQAAALTLQPALKFSNISTAQGLSQSYVFSITQDKEGFIWVATEDGLNRFDGKNFVHYRHKINDPHSLANNIVRKVFVDNQGVLWVGTEQGLSRYNKYLDNFDNYLASNKAHDALRDNFIWDIYQDNQGELWVSTEQGVHKYDRNNNNFLRINLPSLQEKISNIRTLFQDQEGNYWLGTYDQGIFIANKSWTYIQSLQKKNKWQLKIPSNSLFDIKKIDQNYWLATEKGLYIVDNRYQLIKHLHQKSTPQALLANQVMSISQFDDSNVWIATKNGLNILNIFTDKITAYQSTSKPKSLSENFIIDMFKDNNNSMWLGNLNTGVDVYHPATSLFKHQLFNNKKESISVESLTKTKDGTLWFSSYQLGLAALKDNQLVFVNKPETKNISFLSSGNTNNLWFLSYNNSHLYQLNSKTQQINIHRNWQKLAQYNNKYPFIVIQNNLWFTNQQGELTSYNYQNKVFTHYPLHHALQANVNQQNTTQQEVKQAKVLLKTLQQDNQNNLWLNASNNRIYQFNLDTKKFTSIEIVSPDNFQISSATNLAVDNNRLWLTSESQGVMSINLHRLTTTIYNEANNLINNNPTAILLDQQGNAWLSANNGISVINVGQNRVQNFTHDFGLNDNEFISNSALANNQALMGEMFYFGGLNGFHQFKPSEVLKVQQTIPTPVLTNLLVANKKVRIKPQIKPQTKQQSIHHNKTAAKKITTTKIEDSKEKFYLNQQLNWTKKITLAYRQSPFSIEFTSPNSQLSSQIRYRYKLIGLQQNWLDANINTPIATYTNLNAGSYTFIVEAYDSNNPSQHKSKQLTIEILPPWWLSYKAIIVYCLLVLLVISYFILQIRNRRQYHLQIQQSEERLKLSLWGSGDEMWDWNITTGKIYRSNIWKNLDFPQDGTRNALSEQNRIAKDHALTSKEKKEQFKLLQQNGNIHPQDLIRVNHTIEHYLNTCKKLEDQQVFETTYRIKDKDHDNNWIWVLDRGKIVEFDVNNQPVRMTGTLKDISHIKNAEERLKLFAKCIESISDAVVIYNKQFKIIDVNKAYQKITGETKEQALNQELQFKLYADSFTTTVKKHLLVNGSWQGEIESQRVNKESYFADLSIDIIRDESNNISHFVGVFSDISNRKASEAELRKLANSDTLTGLPNRSYFQANQARLVNNKVPHALLVFDLDQFKKINDSLGHEYGDDLLCKIGERIINTARPKDTVYRLGGDEFGLIIENTNDIHTITSIAKTILSHIEQPLKVKNHELVLHSSIGIVLYPEDGNSPQELLKNADTAMYHAKNNGGNQYEFFNDSMNKQAVKRLQVENLIRYGLKHDNFSVFYQPKIEIATGKIAGMEALVRFEHPSKGIVSPVTFIPVSEETGQIIEIGEVVLRKACIATKSWVDAGLFSGRIAVNLSAVQFTQPNLVAMIADILKETQLPAKYLELEITEGTVMDSPQTAIDIMLQIRAMGIHLSLDDFGTGYSSLAYLKKFPLNTLKIDKAFVDDIEHSTQGRNMVATIVTIAHNLGLQVVAEGVEHQLQLDFLTGLKCEQLQGYLYSKPLAEKDFRKYLLSHKIAKNSTHFN